MAMHPQPIPTIPEETARIAHAVLPEGNVWMQMREEFGTLYEDKRYSRKESTAWTGYKVHFTETCEADAPHLIVEVTPTSATMADGEIIEPLHAHLDEQQILPAQHLIERG